LPNLLCSSVAHQRLSLRRLVRGAHRLYGAIGAAIMGIGRMF